MLRVLLAEDSPTQRQLLVHVLRSDPEIELVGQAAQGAEAILLAEQLRPDVIVMDIRMPEVDGFEATKRIMRTVPTPILIVTSNFDARELAISLQALRAGAVHVVPKPLSLDHPDHDSNAAAFVRAVKAVARVKHSLAFPSVRPSVADLRPAGTAKVVALAASTGGPAALHRLFADLPANFPAPILLVQHIAHGFVEGFAAWLNSASSLTITLARDGEELQGGTVYIAPDDVHLGVSGRRIALSGSSPIEGFRPSATHLFASLAAAYGAEAAAVVLTGMGQDGLEGLRAMHAVGAQIIAQSEESCVIFGMPGAVIAAGLASQVLPLTGIAAHLMRIC